MSGSPPPTSPQPPTDEFFRAIVSSIGDGVLSTDAAGRIIFLNRTAERLTGWPAPEALGKAHEEVFQIVSTLDGKEEASPIAAVLRQGVPVGPVDHTLLIARDRTERAIDHSADPIRNSEGRLIGSVLVFRDISAQREAELAALRLAAIIAGSDDAIISKNLDGIVTGWNPAAERIFGYAAAEMIGQSIKKIIPPERIDEENHILGRLRRGVRVEHFQTMRRRRDGQQIPVALTISPIKDRNGRVIGASKIARDITTLKLAEERLQAHAAELEEKVRERTAKLQEMVTELESFSYSLSHDLRAPLRAIHSYAEMVVTDYGDRIPEGVPYLHRIISAASRMDRLIRDVLDFARVSRTEIALQPVTLEPLVDDIIRERPELRRGGAEITIARPLLPVLGHDASLTQCLTNLLDNAVKFVAPGVTPVVRVFTEPSGDRVRICVRDNGIGIDERGRERLFGIFQRLNAADRYQGTGVGLAIVRKAAERMGGSVGVQSSAGLGSTFWIELPRVP